MATSWRRNSSAGRRLREKSRDLSHPLSLSLSLSLYESTLRKIHHNIVLPLSSARKIESKITWTQVLDDGTNVNLLNFVDKINIESMRA